MENNRKAYEVRTQLPHHPASPPLGLEPKDSKLAYNTDFRGPRDPNKQHMPLLLLLTKT